MVEVGEGRRPSCDRKDQCPPAADQVEALRARHAHARARVKEEKTALKEAGAGLWDAEQARDLLQQVAQGVQQVAHARLASVVTRCLKAVFGDDGYDFQTDFVRKRGRTEAVLSFQREGLVVEPATAAGGGAVDVAAFALRLACLLLATPRKRLLLCLDEPLRFVNGIEYQGRVAGLLEVLAEEFGVQLVLVSDDDWLQVGEVVRL